MPSRCLGCSRTFLGLKSHLQKTNDPLCQVYLQHLQASLELHTDTTLNQPKAHHSGVNIDNSPPVIGSDPINIVTDPAGDFFGDYEKYGANDFGMDIGPEEAGTGSGDSDSEDDMLTDAGDEEDSETELEMYEAMVEGHRTGLEPERNEPKPQVSNKMELDSDTTQQKPEVLRVRGGAEAPLGRKPFVVKFPSHSKAGSTYDGVGDPDENTRYTTSLGNVSNMFAPFQSRLEWEIAKWAKTRGASSTAFTDLMGIDGVSRSHGITKLET